MSETSQKKEILTQDSAPKERLMNFTSLMDPILQLLDKHWDISALPKGYENFMKDYEEYKGMGEDEYDLHDEFQELGGVFNTSAGAPALPGLIDMPTVAYNQEEQGRSPLKTLASALVSYGLTIGAAQEKRLVEGQTRIELFERNLELYAKIDKLRAENAKLQEQLDSQNENT